MKRSDQQELLRMALLGYQAALTIVEQKIHDLYSHLAKPGAVSNQQPKRRHYSRQAKQRMAAAQKRRWRLWHQQRKQSGSGLAKRRAKAA